MTKDYLPKHATAAQACEWLQVKSGDNWTLARLIEHGLMPWFWLDYKPGYPAIFGNRVEGYLAPMVFTGDTQRLEVDGTDALVNMTRTHDGVIMKVEPGMRVSIAELRFKREDVQALSKATVKPFVTAGASGGSKPPKAAAMGHSTKTRRNTLTPVIEQAQMQCSNPKDTAEVWATLLILAENKHPPLIGATEDGLQYLKGGEAAIFKRKSLGQRLSR